MYLANTHGLESIRDWYADPASTPEELTAAGAVEGMGLTYSPGRIRTDDEGQFSVYVPQPNPLSTSGYELLYNLSRLQGDERGQVMDTALEGGWHIAISSSDLKLTTWNDDGDRAGALVLDLRPTVQELRDRYHNFRGQVPPEAGLVEGSNERYRAAIYIQNISGSGREDDLDLTYLSGWILLGTTP